MIIILKSTRPFSTSPASSSPSDTYETASNIIRRYLVSSSSKISRDLIRKELLSALNEIFKKDAEFSEIQVKHHDGQDAETSSNSLEGWEVYLGEIKKDLIALSRSGSGLKTVILVTSKPSRDSGHQCREKKSLHICI